MTDAEPGAVPATVLTGRTAVVTGGSRGIGRAVALALAQAGADVAVVARTAGPLEKTALDLAERTGRRVLPVVADTDDTGSVHTMARTVRDRLGPVDILVNGAAAPSGLVRNGIEEADPELLLADLDTKVVGYLRCVQAVVGDLRRSGHGRVVNIGGLTGRASHALSGMRNVAVVHMSKVLSDQLGPDGVTVNTLHPGVVDTEHIGELYQREATLRGSTVDAVRQGYLDRTPIRREIRADEVAAAVVFLCSPAAGGITGESIGIDGGMSRGVFL